MGRKEHLGDIDGMVVKKIKKIALAVCDLCDYGDLYMNRRNQKYTDK
jgi:hypothetical protein